MFAACLKFFEKVSINDLQPIANEIYGESSQLDLPSDAGIFCPKVICVLSHKPFYRAMGRYLKHIYSLSLSSSICPLEHFITSVVSEIPLPCPGGRPFHVVLDAALIAPTSRPMKPIIFKIPNHRFFPLMDLDFAGPLRCLSVDIMLTVFVLMLREAKMVFLSSSNTMLTETMETLRCLLFPLCWSSCFVSRLPHSLSGLLHAPGGFLVGIHLEPSELLGSSPSFSSSSSSSSKLSKNSLQEMMKNYIQHMHFDYPMLSGTYIIDLNSNNTYQFNGKYSESLSNSQIDSILKSIPSGPKLRLKAKLCKIAEEYNIGPQEAGFEELDSAFDFSSSSSITSSASPTLGDDGHDMMINEEDNKIHWEMFPTLELRDAFMSFMIDFLGDYPKFMKPPNDELIEDTYRTFQEEFAVNEYISNFADIPARQSMEFLMETQMFSVLLQQRSEATAEPLVFFEQASNLQRELDLSAGGHTNLQISANQHTSRLIKGGHHQYNHTGVIELPEPVYILLEAEQRWSNLSKVMQQQVLQHSSLYNFEDKAAAKHFTLKYLSSTTLAHTITRNLAGGAIVSVTGGSSGNTGQSIHDSIHSFHESSHSVSNQKLLDLMIFLEFSNGLTELGDDGDTSQHHSTQNYAILRGELDRGDDLHLDEEQFGALILPGPILPNLPTGSTVSEDDQPNAQYSYTSGWPKLNRDLLAQTSTIIHPKLASLVKERAFAIDKVKSLIPSFSCFLLTFLSFS
jgi:hypothetical protein